MMQSNMSSDCVFERGERYNDKLVCLLSDVLCYNILGVKLVDLWLIVYSKRGKRSCGCICMRCFLSL